MTTLNEVFEKFKTYRNSKPGYIPGFNLCGDESGHFEFENGRKEHFNNLPEALAIIGKELIKINPLWQLAVDSGVNVSTGKHEPTMLDVGRITVDKAIEIGKAAEKYKAATKE